jgi:hypothetical protein
LHWQLALVHLKLLMMPVIFTKRIVAANYVLVADDPGCSGTDQECAMYLNQSSTTPVFSGGNVTFDGNGYPTGGSTLLGNENLQ